MQGLAERLKQDFTDQEYREAYADEFLHSTLATQIQVIREQRGMTQEDLASLIGTKQPGISRLENVNNHKWSILCLQKIAFALGCRLKVSFETFESLAEEAENFSEESLRREDSKLPIDKSAMRQDVTIEDVVGKGKRCY